MDFFPEKKIADDYLMTCSWKDSDEIRGSRDSEEEEEVES